MRSGGFTAILLSFIFFFIGCRFEKRDIVISKVDENATWMYWMFDPIIGERHYHVLIDGELDEEAGLERQTRIVGSPAKENQKLIYSAYARLPKGRFSYYLSQDYAGREKFIYHPLKAKKGQIRISIRPGGYKSDSIRIRPKTIPGRQKFYNMPDSDL